MAKTKRSFIQKLIGKDEGYEEEQQVNYGTDFSANANLGGNLDQPQSSFQEEPAPASVAERMSGSPSYGNQGESSVGSRSDSEWVADQEGQLTIDVYQTDTEIIIKSTIAGVKPEDLDVQINNDMVTIKGERKNEQEVKDEDYYYQECYWGAFSRSIILPVDVQANKSEATMKNGILTIRLPKSDSAQARKIQVRGF